MEPEFDLVDPDKIKFRFPCIRARQPIGDLFVASIPHDKLSKISYFDVRRVLQEDRDVERYLGIQRPLDVRRVKDLSDYVNFRDASFPTSIIISIDEEYADFDSEKNEIIIRNFRNDEDRPSIAISQVARVLDGQHRIAGLKEFSGEDFDLSVTIFIGADISDQAQIFATVNLEQNKVNKSLVYDLYELAKSRSPQKTCHNIAIQLDRDKDSPFFERIKRLGLATDGRSFEPITQAAFVEMLLRYISDDPKRDRDDLLRGKSIEKISGDEIYRLPFRNMFIDKKDVEIGIIIFNYFSAVRRKWPESWGFRGRGQILNRTNGFRALMRFLRKAYLSVGAPGDVPSIDKFYEHVFHKIEYPDGNFSVDYFKPGSSGEARMLRVFTREEVWPLEQVR